MLLSFFAATNLRDACLSVEILEKMGREMLGTL